MEITGAWVSTESPRPTSQDKMPLKKTNDATNENTTPKTEQLFFINTQNKRFFFSGKNTYLNYRIFSPKINLKPLF